MPPFLKEISDIIELKDISSPVPVLIVRYLK